jgi:hypothetical protein
MRLVTNEGMAGNSSWDGRGMSPQKPQPESVDYTGSTLSAGQTVTFIEADQESSGRSRLYTGEIKLIGKEQLVIESNSRLFMVSGREDRHLNAYYFVTVLGLSAAPHED